MITLPRIVVTGASGFLGRLLVHLLRRRHQVVAVDRRTLAEAEMADHPNVQWYQLDLTDADALREAFGCIRAGGRVEVLIHLAAYYDFTGDEHPEYQRTNVDAMRLLLEASRDLGLEHFVFASSVAACPFSTPGRPITEATPPDGTHVYARTKREGERMLADSVDSFTPVIVRFAALFSDWCEYPPLQVLLDTWMSGRWNASIIAGRGASAIPYLHVRDGAFFIMRVLERRKELQPLEVLIAGNDGAVSHLELYRAATAYLDGAPRRAVHIPRPLCRPGIWLRDLVGRALGSRPFERTWMADYVDRRMEIDAGHTRRRLGWSPTTRLALLARLPFLIEHARDNPMEWYRRNREALEHLRLTPNYSVYRLLKVHESSIEQGLRLALSEPESLGGGSAEERFWDGRVTLRNLIAAVRSGHAEPFLSWCRSLAERRAGEGVAMDEVVAAVRSVERVILDRLERDPEGARLARELHDHVSTTVELGVDRVLEVYEDAAAFGTER